MKKLFSYSVYDICETGLLVAGAIILDLYFLKIRIGGSGGSFSVTLLPLYVLALRQGPFKGFVGCGIIYGVIACLLDGYGFQTFPLEYLIAYGSVALIGFTPIIVKDVCTPKFYLFALLFGVIAMIIRLMCGTIDSMIFYEYKFVPALAYNAAYTLPSGAVAIAGLLLLIKPLSKIGKKHGLA